jgi:hypothetical protein
LKNGHKRPGVAGQNLRFAGFIQGGDGVLVYGKFLLPFILFKYCVSEPLEGFNVFEDLIFSENLFKVNAKTSAEASSLA